MSNLWRANGAMRERRGSERASDEIARGRGNGVPRTSVSFRVPLRDLLRLPQMEPEHARRLGGTQYTQTHHKLT